MFLLLDMINGLLGYFNFSVKIKNWIYVGLVFFGDLYLIYVIFMFLKNQFWLWGFLYFLVVVGVIYYFYLNVVYYFLGKILCFDFLLFWLFKLIGMMCEIFEEKECQWFEKLVVL